eukprot:6208647-Pleurochrysis_carterae.AAC.1
MSIMSFLWRQSRSPTMSDGRNLHLRRSDDEPSYTVTIFCIKVAMYGIAEQIERPMRRGRWTTFPLTSSDSVLLVHRKICFEKSQNAYGMALSSVTAVIMIASVLAAEFRHGSRRIGYH